MTPRICELVEASLADLPVMQAMATYYVYDMSEFVGREPGWKFPETGLYECESLRPYFEDPDAHPHLVRVAGELAGFAIVDTKGSGPEVEFNMAQFFVHRKFKGRGVGLDAARQCFERFAGAWEVNVIPANRGAFAFWSRIIPQCAKGVVEQSRRPAPHLRGAVKDFFRFRT
ncbi:MAG: GNAT family N-acetyltransferase [Caulobacteraceae bacterium]